MTHVELAVLAACADGTLPAAEAARVREHLGECRSCMAAYVDAVRYRAAWLADPDAFRLASDDRPLAREFIGGGDPRSRFRRNTAVLASAAALAAVWIVVGVPMNSAPSLGFRLSPAVLEATARSSAEGLVLPGAENDADRLGLELRGGGAAGSVELDREVKLAIEEYERGVPGAETSARAVAALLAHGEIDAARDYARESLARHPHAIPLLVFAADARYRANDLGGAEALLRRAAERAPGDPLVTLDLGMVLLQSRRPDEARRLLQQVAGGRSAPLAARARRELAESR